MATTTLRQSQTTGERFLVQEADGFYLMSGPLQSDDVAKLPSDLDEVSFDGEAASSDDLDGLKIIR